MVLGLPFQKPLDSNLFLPFLVTHIELTFLGVFGQRQRSARMPFLFWGPLLGCLGMAVSCSAF